MTRVRNGPVGYVYPRHQFVFLNRCGCPRGVVEGSYAGDEDGAWDMFADDRRDERRLRAEGVTVVHVDHDTYSRDFYPLMLVPCPHSGMEGSG